MGTITIVIAVAPAIGPTIGGVVLSSLGWRWMFWIVLPLAVTALLVGAFWFRLTGRPRPVPLDLWSVLLSAIGFGGVLYGLSALGQSAGGNQSLPPWIPICVGLGALAVFCWRQTRLQRQDRALLDLRPLTHRDFTIALVVNALLFVCLLGIAAIMLPLYLQAVLHTSTFVSGLAVLPGGLILGLLGRPVGTLFDRYGARPLVIPGALAMAVSLWVFALLSPGSPLVVVIAGHVLFMAGFGFMITPLMAQSLGVLPNRLYSHGSAILSTIQQLAGAFGTALFISIATLASTHPARAPDANGMHTAFLTAGFIGVLTLLASLFIRSAPATGDGDS